MKIGLTGGIGCGKSTVLRLCAERGALTVESDAIVRDLLARDPEVIATIRNAFGGEVLDREGKIDRSSLGGMVANDSDKLLRLESILHPIVRRVWTHKVAEQNALAIVEIPLLFEKDLQGLFDQTVCVASSPSVQMKRLRARGLSDSQIEWRQQRQLPLARKMELADVVLINNGTLEHLNEQLNLLFQRWGAASLSG